ncbi:MAG: T9SS type A sorting domain-containing protein [Flavobacteriales bacterium]
MNKTLLAFTLLFSSVLCAQNWAPFPYDSVFFENATTHKVMLPFVKMSNNQTIPIYAPSFITQSFDIGDNAINKKFRANVKPWMGDVILDDQNITFVGAFNDTVSLNLNNLSSLDTISYHFNYISFVDSLERSIPYYLQIEKVIEIDATNSDSLLVFQFAVLDSNLNITDNFISSSSPIDQNINGKQLVYSKNKGIIETPSWGMFPFCSQYKLGDGFENTIDSFHFSNRIHHLNIGDEIHTQIKHVNIHHLNDINTEYHKYVVTNSVLSSNQEFIYNTFDVWKRHRRLSSVVDTTTFSQYSRTDTIALNESYNKLPNGLIGEWNEDIGYYYQISKFGNRPGVFRNEHSASVYVTPDTINKQYLFVPVGPGYFHRTDYYLFGLSLKFYSVDHGFSHTNFEPVYYKLQDQEWGNPYSDPFILETPEHENPTQYYFTNNSIHWKSELNITSARIYDIQGKIISVHPSVLANDQLNINYLSSGTYFLILQSDQQSVNYKFTKH